MKLAPTSTELENTKWPPKKKLLYLTSYTIETRSQWLRPCFWGRLVQCTDRRHGKYLDGVRQIKDQRLERCRIKLRHHNNTPHWSVSWPHGNDAFAAERSANRMRRMGGPNGRGCCHRKN